MNEKTIKSAEGSKTINEEKSTAPQHSNLFHKIQQAREAAGITTPIVSTLTDEQKKIVESLQPGETITVEGVTYSKES